MNSNESNKLINNPFDDQIDKKTRNSGSNNKELLLNRIYVNENNSSDDS